MNVLITGAAGFVGKHLIKYLQSIGQDNISVLVLKQEEVDSVNEYKVDVHIADILDMDSLKNVISDVNPDQIYHLAAQSSVGLSWSHPALTADVNIKGTINLLEAARYIAISPRILLVGSGDEYGNPVIQDMLLSENAKLAPTNVYAVTKACQNMLGSVYAHAYNMDIVMTRAFNHIGPGQSPVFVVSDFCKQAVEIAKGKAEPVIKVGNIAARRDFTDVRDVVRAYALLMQKGITGETYNISSNKSVSINEILDIIISQFTMNISIEVEMGRYRPTDAAVLEADSTKLRDLTGWENLISLEQSIKDTIGYWEEVV